MKPPNRNISSVSRDQLFNKRWEMEGVTDRQLWNLLILAQLNCINSSLGWQHVKYKTNHRGFSHLCICKYIEENWLWSHFAVSPMLDNEPSVTGEVHPSFWVPDLLLLGLTMRATFRWLSSPSGATIAIAERWLNWGQIKQEGKLQAGAATLQ